MVPESYSPKIKALPVWLDFMLFGPPAVRDSSPGMMAFIFGRTEHDTMNGSKSCLRRFFNGACILILYFIVLYLPAHLVLMDGVAEYWRGATRKDPPVSCALRLFRACEPGCERRALFDKCGPK